MKRRSTNDNHRWLCLLAAFALIFGAVPAMAEIDEADLFQHEGGIIEPTNTSVRGEVVRVPNTDQSVDGVEQSLTHPPNTWVLEDAFGATSMLGHTIDHVASPNDDMRAALLEMVLTAQANDEAGLDAAAEDLKNILLGTTEGRIYDGFSMLNYNRFKPTDFGALDMSQFPADVVEGEYKMKVATDSGDTAFNAIADAEVPVLETDISFLYYDGQIDSDTFLVRFNQPHTGDELLRVHYRLYSMVNEDLSPTLVMLDHRMAQNTVSFPFKGFDAVWIAFLPGQILNVTVNYPPIRMVRGVYNWGWRVHPPRIQFMQPVYEVVNAHTDEIELDPQGESFAYRTREELTLENIASIAPEKKMYMVAKGVLLDGWSTVETLRALTEDDQGPRGTWVGWADLVKEQRQLPPEVWDRLAVEDGLAPGEFGDFKMVTVFVNQEFYGEGPFLNEVVPWDQGEVFKVKLINFDGQTHYFRNVDFGTRLNEDILNCCGGGETSFEVMNFKPSYGGPKVAEMQWRAGWGFRPHYDVIQQHGVFPRGSDRTKLQPYKGGGLDGGEGGIYWGFQYSEENRQGDFRFNPPPFIIGEDFANPAGDVLRDADGQPGLIIGQKTEGYGKGGQFCPESPGGFCPEDIAEYNWTGARNWPPPPLQGQPDGNGGFFPDAPTELRFPPFLRNPCQGDPDCGDIIPPTGAWRPFLWVSPHNGTLFNNGVDSSDGYWADYTYSHGAPIFAGQSLNASIELPRAAGQVFYQFDDLFHDNVIFSPHPLAEGADLKDDFKNLRAVLIGGGKLAVRGTLSPALDEDGANFPEYVAIFAGSAGVTGCTGDYIAQTSVNQENGKFVLRCTADKGKCFNLTDLLKNNFGAGDEICVQSPISAFESVVVE